MENQTISNGRKHLLPSIINGPEVIASLLDEAKLFTMNFTSKTKLDDKDYSLHNFFHHKICTISILAWAVSRVIKILDSMKVTGLDEITAVVLKNFGPEIIPILEELFNCYLKKKCVSSSWKLSALLTRMWVRTCPHHSIIPSAPLVSSANFLTLSSIRNSSTKTISRVTNSMIFAPLDQLLMS